MDQKPDGSASRTKWTTSEPKLKPVSKPTTRAPTRSQSRPQPPPQVQSTAQPRPTQRRTNPNQTAWLRQNTSLQITAVNRADLKADPSPVTSTSDYKLLCSYNWHESIAPTIYVPGSPPRWQHQSLPLTLPEDEGGRYIDQNAHRVPMYPFEPMFQAMTVMNPNHNFDDVDFVANRNSMRKLLNFVTGRLDQDFRIDLDMVGNTLFFSRRERRTRENKFPGQKHLGFGHSFERRFTAAEEGLEDSTSHHRVARYKFGDLECVIRYEVDAWMAAEDVGGNAKSNLPNATVDDSEIDHDGLLKSLQGLSLTKKQEIEPPLEAKSTVQESTKGTRVIVRGTEGDVDRLAEMKAKAKRPRMSDVIPQLWFGRVGYLIVGMHDKGQFHDVLITETENEFRNFETMNQDNLRKVVGLIKVLRQETTNCKDKACVIICYHKTKPLRLEVYSTSKKKPVLADELIKRHWSSGRLKA